MRKIFSLVYFLWRLRRAAVAAATAQAVRAAAAVQAVQAVLIPHREVVELPKAFHLQELFLLCLRLQNNCYLSER